MHGLYLLLALVAAAVTISLPGCGPDSEPGGAGGAGGFNTDTRIIVIREYSPERGQVDPIGGVKVCATDTDDCVRTNTEGRAVVQIPVDREFSFTLEKDGYGKELLVDFEPPGLSLFAFGAASLEEEGAFYTIHEQVGSPYPMEGTGSILIIPLDSRFSNTSTSCLGVAGRTFELSGATGRGYYHDERGNWDASLIATSCWGWGGFTEVPPGEVQVEIKSDAENCEVFHGWPGTVANSVRMPVRAGFLTEVWVDCGVLE